MSHVPYTPEEYKKNVSSIWKTTLILSVITIAEVILAINSDKWGVSYGLLAFLVSFASLVKAYYIMNVFMHLSHETKGFKFVVLFPFLFLFWGFISFSYDGLSFAGMREGLNAVFIWFGY